MTATTSTKFLDAQVSVSTAVALPAAAGGLIPGLSGHGAYIQPVDGDIFMSRDGTDPSSTHGVRIYSGTAWPVEGDLNAVRLIAVSGTVTVNLQFLG